MFLRMFCLKIDLFWVINHLAGHKNRIDSLFKNSHFKPQRKSKMKIPLIEINHAVKHSSQFRLKIQHDECSNFFTILQAIFAHWCFRIENLCLHPSFHQRWIIHVELRKYLSILFMHFQVKIFVRRFINIDEMCWLKVIVLRGLRRFFKANILIPSTLINSFGKFFPFHRNSFTIWKDLFLKEILDATRKCGRIESK